MNGVRITALSSCGMGEALVALKARGLDRAPMTQALSADAMRRRAEQFSPQRRALLVDVLRAQCGPQPSEEHLALLERLAQPDTVTVTAGHQLVTAVGPLYVHAKIAETQALAEHWTNQGVPTVPVFWMATEDHDLDEIRRVFWRGRAVGAWAQPAEPLRSGAVPAERAARAIQGWREQEALPEAVRAAAERSEAGYRASETLADATR
ncbi:MAG: bacillithiol biosynthesis BshC, partial [Ignavibacteria bacterium]|nr:bacillithiol biosynthesis BshC [Ignavibacteria bacterium]